MKRVLYLNADISGGDPIGAIDLTNIPHADTQIEFVLRLVTGPCNLGEYHEKIIAIIPPWGDKLS
jgi:hypothetical protein